MRRFDKKKNIKLLNERINKKPTSLTENSWADDLRNDEFPEEFKGMYDDDVLGDDPHGEHLYGDGPQHWTDKHGKTVIDPSDFDSAFDSEQRAMQMDSGYGLEGGSEEMFDGPMELEAEGKFHPETGLPMGPNGEPPVVDDHYYGDFESDFDPETIARMKRKHGLGEDSGEDFPSFEGLEDFDEPLIEDETEPYRSNRKIELGDDELPYKSNRHIELGDDELPYKSNRHIELDEEGGHDNSTSSKFGPGEMSFSDNYPGYMDDREVYDLFKQRFPNSQISYEDLVDYRDDSVDGIYGENKKGQMNVLSEQSLKAFDKLCGVKLIKENEKKKP